MEVCQGNMLKVCHFTSVHDAKDRRIFSKECCSLAKLGFKVFIVAPNAVSEVIHPPAEKTTYHQTAAVGCMILINVLWKVNSLQSSFLLRSFWSVSSNFCSQTARTPFLL